MKFFSTLFIAFLTVTTVFAQVPTNGLVAYYSFDDCTGFDFSGQGSNGTLFGDSCAICGVSGQAFFFNGQFAMTGGPANYMLALNQVNNIFDLNDFSVSFYMKSTNGQGNKDILSKREGCNDDNAFAIRFLPATNSIAVDLSENASKSAPVSAPLDFGHCWQHIVFVRQNTRSSLYINGTLRAESSAGSRVDISNNAVLSIANSPCQSTTEVPFAGVLDEMRFYDRALAVSEIESLYFGPDKIVNNDLTVFLGESVDLESTMSCANNFLWQPSDFLLSDDTPTTTSTPTSSITYTLNFTEDNVCIAFDTVRITVIDPADLNCEEVYLPKAFTPNDDGLNDTYGISNPYAVLDLISLEIFDRWGARVFFTDEPFGRWNGEFKNDPVNPGVMLYKVRFRCNGEEKVDVGSLSIIR